MSLFFEWKYISDIHHIMQMMLGPSYSREIVLPSSSIYIIFLILSIIVILWVTWLIARRDLSYLSEIASLAERITAESLSGRLNINKLPIEFAELGLTLNKMLNRFETAYQRMSDCAAELAHELRTPLNNLTLSTEIVLTQERSKEDYKRILECNVEEYQQLNNTIESVLFLARSNNEKITLDKIEIELDQFMQNLYQFYQISAREKNITFNMRAEGIVVADQVLLRRALNNLLDNAIKYIPKGGEVTLLTQQRDDSMHLSVIDNGPGIKPEVMPHISKRFYQTGTSLDSNKPGLGLGLAIVQSIMQMHRGRFIISKAKPQGACMTLVFKR